MHYKLLFPSKYLSAHDLQNADRVVTIEGVKVDTLTMRGGVTESKPIVSFVGKKKKLVMNKTNAETIAGMYGNEINDWKGKPITLYPTTTQCGRETKDCIRVRPQVPRANAAQLPASADDDYADETTNHPLAVDLANFANIEVHEAAQIIRDYCDKQLNCDLSNITNDQADELRNQINDGSLMRREF